MAASGGNRTGPIEGRFHHVAGERHIGHLGPPGELRRFGRTQQDLETSGSRALDGPPPAIRTRAHRFIVKTEGFLEGFPTRFQRGIPG